MESIGFVSDGEWSSLSGTCSSEEADFMAQLLNSCSVLNELNESSSLAIPFTYNWPDQESALINMNYIPHGIGYNEGDLFLPCDVNGNHHFNDSSQLLLSMNGSGLTDFVMEDVRNITSLHVEGENNYCLSQETSEEDYSLKKKELLRESEMRPCELLAIDNKNNPNVNSKKRFWNSENIQKVKKSVRLKKNEKSGSISNDEEEGIIGSPNGQSTSGCSWEDGLNLSQENNNNGGVSSSLSPKGPVALNLNGKTRANRGSATDPQSLYARKRRERINERLRILQNLVPNGTKVDISTMLEEAVKYVKFLQLQIKLLSSDDLWIYAPLAYNGMDIGLDMKLIAPRE